MKEKLGVFLFGQKLLRTLDLDPVYVMLHASNLGQLQLRKWLVAYWCFYHCGTASWIADQPDFYKGMKEAARSKAWPRGSERRHFRGEQALRAVESMREQFKNPNVLVQTLVSNKPQKLAEVVTKVKTLRGFGDWISFKVADMLDRLGLSKVEFSADDIFSMFDSPKQGAQLMFSMYNGSGEPSQWALQRILAVLGSYKAPPMFERAINVQEVETILCKWKSHMNGHYEVGKDIREIREALERFKLCKTSQALLRGMKKGGL